MDYFLWGLLAMGLGLAVGAYVKASRIEKALIRKGVLENGWDKE